MTELAASNRVIAVPILLSSSKCSLANTFGIAASWPDVISPVGSGREYRVIPHSPLSAPLSLLFEFKEQVPTQTNTRPLPALLVLLTSMSLSPDLTDAIKFLKDAGA